MLKKYFKRKKPKVYLDYVKINERNIIGSIQAVIDGSAVFSEGLLSNLNEIFFLPLLDSSTLYHKTDRGLQVEVAHYSLGNLDFASAGGFFLPLIWRPKITVVARLFNISSGKKIVEYSITQKMPIKQYLNKVFSFRTAFNEKDLEYLLYQGCHRILKKLIKV